jgi:hypothetical protein
MLYRRFAKHSLFFLWIASAVWLGPLSSKAQKQTRSFPGEHTDEKLNPSRPDKQASDLTRDVAAKLPRIGASDRAVVIRNLIDQHIFGSMARDKVPHAPLTSDYEFCRRVHLDLTGRIPTPERLKAFVESGDPNKRDKLIDELIESQAWVENWGYW